MTEHWQPYEPSTSEPQSPEELAAHFGPEGPVVAAREFLEAIFTRRDYRAAWARMDDNHRLCRAQAWLWNNRERLGTSAARHIEEVALLFAQDPPEQEMLWQAFTVTELNQLLDSWGSYDPVNLSAASRQRPRGPDLELVLFMDTKGESIMVDRETLVHAQIMLLMRSTPAGWLVAGFTDLPPVPGWPPEFPAADPPRGLPDHN